MTAFAYDDHADYAGAIPRFVHNGDNDAPAAPTRDQAAAARLAWEVAVDQLVRPGLYVIHRQDDRHEVAEVLPLLDQVQEAVTPGSKVPGKTVLGSRPPASLGALTLLGEIRTEVRKTCRTHGHPGEGLREQVRHWGAHAEQWQHTAPDYVLWAADRANEWVRAARLMLDPEPRFPLRGRACPACGTATVQVWSDDEGDWVRRPALSIDPHEVEAVCAHCGQRWGLDVWEQLAATLEQQLQQETLT
jgi:hypothetical protein